MKHTMGAAALICLLGAAPAVAQTNAGARSGRTGPADRAFARQTAIGGMAEVELGKIATERAASGDVKAFGRRMVADHSKANAELKQWAQRKKIALPPALDATHRATRDRLAKLSGAAFDKAYMREMVADHEHDVAEFKKESKTGLDADLKTWAAKTLPTLQEHLTLAQGTALKVGAPR